MRVLVLTFLTVAVVAGSPHKHKGIYHEGNHTRYIMKMGEGVPLSIYISSTQQGPLQLVYRDTAGALSVISEEFEAEPVRTFGPFAQKITFNVPAKLVEKLGEHLRESLSIKLGDPTNGDCKPNENCGIGTDCIDPDNIIAATLREDDVHLRHMYLSISAAQYVGACTSLFKHIHDESWTTLTAVEVPERHVELGPNLKNFYFEYLYPACDYSVDVRKYTCNAINLDYNSISYDYTTPLTPQGFHLQFDEEHKVEAHIYDKENGQCGPIKYEYTYTIHDGDCTGNVIGTGGTGTIDQSWPSHDFNYETVVATSTTLPPFQAVRGCITAIYKDKRSEMLCDCVRWAPDFKVHFPCSRPSVSDVTAEEFVVSWEDLAPCGYQTDLLQYKVVVSVNDKEKYTEIVTADQLSLTLPHAGPGMDHKVCVRSLLNCKDTTCNPGSDATHPSPNTAFTFPTLFPGTVTPGTAGTDGTAGTVDPGTAGTVDTGTAGTDGTVGTVDPGTAGTVTPATIGTETPTTIGTETPATVGTETPATVRTETPGTVGTETPATVFTEAPVTVGTDTTLGPVTIVTEVPVTDGTDATLKPITDATFTPVTAVTESTVTAVTADAATAETPKIPSYRQRYQQDRGYSACPAPACGEECCTTFTTPPACVEMEGCVQTLPVDADYAKLTCGFHNPNSAAVTTQLVCKGDRSRLATYESFKWSANLGAVQWGDVKECQWEVTAENCNSNDCKKICDPFTYPVCPDCPSNFPLVSVVQASAAMKKYSVTIEDDKNLCGNDNELTYVVNFGWRYTRSDEYRGVPTCARKTVSVLAQYDTARDRCVGTVDFIYSNDCYGVYYYDVKAHTKSTFEVARGSASDQLCWARQWWDCTTEGTPGGVARCVKKTQHE